jgi:hypothetical protein
VSSGAQLEEARRRDKLAALPLLIRDPMRARMEESHNAAHQQLQREVARVEAHLSPLRARNRLRKLRPLIRLLDRTDHVCTSPSDVPCRAERHRLVDPVLAELEKVAKSTRSPRRDRTLRISAQQQPPKEAPMVTDRCVVEGHPHHPGGCIIEGPRDEPRRATQNGHAIAGLPLDLANEVADWQRNFLAPNFSAVRVQKCDRLARYLLDRPADAQRAMLARVLYHVGMQWAGR